MLNEVKTLEERKEELVKKEESKGILLMSN